MPDNLKSGVAKAHRYDPDINRAYQDFAEYYQLAVLPARVRKPRDKAKVESGVLVVERWILARLRNQDFFSLGELNKTIAKLIERLNTRPFKKIEGNRRSRFEALELPTLKPLPAKPYEFGEWRKAKVHPDYHIEVARAYYSVPYRLIGERVDVRLTARAVEIFHAGQLVAAHPRAKERAQRLTRRVHRPEKHIAVIDQHLDRVLERAFVIGPATFGVVQAQAGGRKHPEETLRGAQGILRLAHDFSPARLEAACERALALKACSYRAVRTLIQTPLSPPASPSLDLAHENVRGAKYFQLTQRQGVPMLTEPLIQQLHQLRLAGMAAALEQQQAFPDLSDRSFEDRLGIMIQHEFTERATHRLTMRLRWAKLPVPACIEDIDTRSPRGLDPAQFAQVSDLGWIREHLNVLITGPTGVGKSYLSAALAHVACRADFSVRCFRLPRLVEELARYGAMQRRSAFFRQLAKADLLLLDDFGLAPLSDETVRDLLEILDDRYDRRATLITSQLPIDQWHAYLGDRTVADAILDRVVHNSYRLILKGESMRRPKTVGNKSSSPSKSKNS